LDLWLTYPTPLPRSPALTPLPPIGSDVQTLVDGVDFVAPSPISNHDRGEKKKKSKARDGQIFEMAFCKWLWQG